MTDCVHYFYLVAVAGGITGECLRCGAVRDFTPKIMTQIQRMAETKKAEAEIREALANKKKVVNYGKA